MVVKAVGLAAILGAVFACTGGQNSQTVPVQPSLSSEQEPSTSTSPLPSEEAGYYLAEQAERGREVFVGICSECHTQSDFRGKDFEWNWRRQTVRNLFSEMTETMPENDPGSLSDETYVAVIAYILQLNQYPSGEVALIPTRDVMDLIPLGPNARKPSQERP